MVLPPDNTPESLDGQGTSDGEPDRPVEKSVGDGKTIGIDPSTESGGEAFAEDWTPPEMLADRYRLEDELGRGGMGVVYRAHDTQRKRTVAVKLIFGGTVARFQTEAEAIAQLDHPNIVHVYEFNQQDDLHYIVMSFIQGESLSQRLDWEGTIPVEEAIGITVSLCDALTHAHGKGIIHRDIKPSNVLLSSEGIPRLVDFGLARIESDQGQHTRAGATLGTIDYMSPEQRRDASGVDHRSDLWSLAASLYHMITGRVPGVIQLRDLANSLQKVLGKALEDAPDSRYQSADDFRDALKVVLDSPVTHQPWTVPEGELAKGQCTQCGVINDLARKFCEECATALRVSCLSCEQQIPVWDKVCGECGGRQLELLAERRSGMQQQRAEAKSLRAEHEMETSRAIAEQIADESDDRLQQDHEWATGFLESFVEESVKYFKRGVAHRQNGDFEAAISDFTEAIRLNLEYAQAYFNRGVTHGKNGDFEAAISDYTEAIRLNPDYADKYRNRYVDAYNNRGFDHNQNGDFEAAISDYTEAIRLNPGDAFTHHARGIAHYNNDDARSAITDLTEAIRRNPEDAVAHHNRHIAYDRIGDVERAKADHASARQLGYKS
ncbi:MAG: protein kinase [Planctomycetaceae bacterium]|jgi:Flp pilus assembly protein TadD|nr:protein kinase [Planctomycetaceae bacterium]